MAFESKSSSRCTTEKANGTHVFEIVGYSLKKGMGVGEFVRSATFTVGGYDWSICFYPDGFRESSKDVVSIFLELRSENTEVRTFYDLRVVNHVTGLAKSMRSAEAAPRANKFCIAAPIRGRNMQRRLLERKASGYIQDDCLTIECVLTVIKESHVSEANGGSEIKVPPSDLSDHFGKLMCEEEGADVTLSVGGETFAAHKIVLVTRSPVFKAELYGQMKERRARCVTIESMQPAVFRALLHFIYTDSLPADMDDLDDDNCSKMIRHLLVAADRYAMDRLKLMCQSIFCEHYIGVETVATTLALADQHNCDRLKDVCIEFIASSDEMDAVVATKGYANLKRTCPSVLIDVLEKASRFRRA